MINVENLTYTVDGLDFICHMAFAHEDTPKPAVLIFPSWAGRDSFVCDTAERLANQGYVGVAIDLYGDARVGTSKDENASLMNPLVSDRRALASRLKAALDAVASVPQVDSRRIAVIGYCFGGLCALDCARNNFPICGAVSLHGALPAAEHHSTEAIVPPILVLHGFQDPLVPMNDFTVFTQEMRSRQANWECDIYGGAMHSFTNPSANDEDFGTVYDKQSSDRSWARTLDFLLECFK